MHPHPIFAPGPYRYEVAKSGDGFFSTSWARRIAGPGVSLFLLARGSETFDLYADESRSMHLLHGKSEPGRGFTAPHVSQFASTPGVDFCTLWHVFDQASRGWIGAFIVRDHPEKIVPRSVRVARADGLFVGELVDDGAGGFLRDAVGASVPISLLLGGQRLAGGIRPGSSVVASNEKRLDLLPGCENAGDLRVPLVAMAFF